MNIRQISIFTQECNYGQRLQEYALQKFILNNFSYNISLYDTTGFIKSHNNKNVIQLLKFKQFEDNYMNICKFNLNDCFDDIDYFICGSDMVFNWNFWNSENCIKYFTFDFLKKHKNVITYATSFPPSIVSKYKNRYLKLNNRLDYISVREYDNINSLYSIHFTIPIIYHIDPVFLLSKDEWLNISKKPNIKLNNNFNFNYYTEYGFGIPFVNDKTDKIYIGPEEFIWLINNCQKIYTNSYHCFCLSLIFKKECIITDNQIDNFRFKNLNNIMKMYNNFEEFIHIEKSRSLNYFKRKLI